MLALTRPFPFGDLRWTPSSIGRGTRMRETKMPRRGNLRGAESASAAHDVNKNPENKKRFRGLKSNQTRLSLIPSSIQTVTVGLGVPPSHVLSVVEALVGCTTDREFTCTRLHFVQVSPCPEGCYLVVQIITRIRCHCETVFAHRSNLQLSERLLRKVRSQ